MSSTFIKYCLCCLLPRFHICVKLQLGMYQCVNLSVTDVYHIIRIFKSNILVGGDLSPIVEVELSSGEFRSDRAFDGKSVAELRASVEMCCSLPPTVHTVISCAALAQQFSDLAHEVSRSCEQLVHEQHLQHQVRNYLILNVKVLYLKQYVSLIVFF